MRRLCIVTICLGVILCGVVGATEELLPSEKLIRTLLTQQPDIDATQHVFLSWRGFSEKNKHPFDLVLVNRGTTTHIVTASTELGELFKKKKKRTWQFERLPSGESILSFPRPEGGLETLIEKRFAIRIVSKSTIFAS